MAVSSGAQPGLVGAGASARPVVRLGTAKGGWFRRVGWSHLIGVLALSGLAAKTAFDRGQTRV